MLRISIFPQGYAPRYEPTEEEDRCVEALKLIGSENSNLSRSWNIKQLNTPELALSVHVWRPEEYPLHLENGASSLICPIPQHVVALPILVFAIQDNEHVLDRREIFSPCEHSFELDLLLYPDARLSSREGKRCAGVPRYTTVAMVLLKAATRG